jgi:hypothetical protein
MSKFNLLKTVLGLMTVVAVFVVATSARADGFVCNAVGESLRVKVYNRTQPEEGTRNVAVMVISDPSKPVGQRTLQRFTADNDGVTNSGTRYSASLKPRLRPMMDVQIGGVQVGQIQEVALNIDFSYRYPIGNEGLVAGTLEIYQVNGDQLWMDVDCTRYLKGSK